MTQRIAFPSCSFVRAAVAGSVAMLAAALPSEAQAPAPPSSGSAAVTLPITFFGEVRSRSEYDRPGDPATADAFTLLRTRFGARVDAAPGARIVLQLQDSRVLGAEGNTGATAPDVFELHQGYVELSAPWSGVGLALRAGRQEIALGNERLVGSVGWSNVGRSFDGARLMLAPRGAIAGAERWTATLFGATIEERGRRFGSSAAATAGTPSQSDHAAVGAFASRALGGGSLETTVLYDAGMRYRAYENANRATFDARLRANRLLGLGAELEGAWQLGHQRVAATAITPQTAQRVRAWLLGARLGTPTDGARRVAASLGIDALSGDASPGDGSYGAFNTMFATNHPFYGLMDLFLDRQRAPRIAVSSTCSRRAA